MIRIELNPEKHGYDFLEINIPLIIASVFVVVSGVIKLLGMI